MGALILQSFGNVKEYTRAIFTTLTFIAHDKSSERTVFIFTDNPDFFLPYLGNVPVQFIRLTPERLRAMRGEIDFLHRIKIAVIDEAFGMVEHSFIYADSDTFFVKDPSPLVDQVSPENSFMHKREYEFKTLERMPMPSGLTFRAFYDQIAGNKFQLADGSFISISPELFSWNAGVMMFHPSHRILLQDVYKLTDQFFITTSNHASEQYAFSILLQRNTTLKPCEEVIYHYWHRIEKQIVDEFLSKHITASWGAESIENRVQDVREWSRILPSLISNDVLMVRDHAIQAFHEDRVREGFRNSFRAIVKSPFNFQFIRHVLYHTREILRKAI